MTGDFKSDGIMFLIALGVIVFVIAQSVFFIVKSWKRAKELGISAVRGGTIVGDHEVIFAGTDEVITLQHTAYSRAVFGKGAIAAAKFLAGKPAGLYDMSDVIG